MENNIEVSVIIPMYNTEKHLTRCFNSVVKALGNINYEIIIINDGSTDNTAKIAKRYVSNNKNFYYYELDHVGPGASRNYGLKQARGKYVHFIDSDDFVSPNLIKEMFEIAENNDSQIVVCNAVRIENGHVKPSVLHLNTFSKIGLKDSITNVKNNPSLMWDTVCWNKLIRRDFLIDNDITFVESVLFEDMLTVTKMLYYASRITLCRTRGYFWTIRTDTNSITQTIDFQVFNDKLNAISSQLEFLDENNASKEIRELYERKSVTNDFIVFLNNLDKFNEKKEEVISLMGDFYKKNLSKVTINSLPLINRQITLDIINNNINHLEEMIEYKKTGNSKVPIKHIDNQYYFEYPEDFFEFDERNVKHDFLYTVPISTITRIKQDAFRFEIEGHLYHDRIAQDSFDDLIIKPYLYNNISGKYKELEIERIKNNNLTKSKITKDNQAYNYDCSGFLIRINFEEDFLGDEFLGRNYIVLYYESSINNGYRVLRGLSYSARLALPSINCFLDDYVIKMDYEIDNSLDIYIQKYGDDRELKSIITNLRNEKQELLEYFALMNETNKKMNDYITNKLKENEKLKKQIDVLNKKLKENEELKKQIDFLNKKLRQSKESLNYRIGYYISWLPKKIYYLFKKRK